MKNKIWRKLSEFEDSDNYKEDSDDDEYERNTDDTKNQTLMIGRGHFGKEFIVREGI